MAGAGSIGAHHLLAERGERKDRHLHRGDAQGEPDDGDAQQQAGNHVADGQSETTEHQPQDVADTTDRSTCARPVDHDSPERPQRVAGELERLQAERDADDCDAVEHSGHDVGEGQPPPGQDQPQHVAEHLHAGDRVRVVVSGAKVMSRSSERAIDGSPVERPPSRVPPQGLEP